MKRIIKKASWHISALSNSVLCLVNNKKLFVKVRADKKVCFVFTLMNYRFYYPVIKHMHDSGYMCYIKFNYKFFSNASAFFLWLQNLPRILVSFTVPEDVDLVVVDDFTFKPASGVKVLFLSDNSYDKNFRPILQNLLPFSMHPDIYIAEEDKKIEQYRLEAKKVRVFFSGNVSAEGYRDDVLNILHKKLGRRQIIKAVFENFPDDINHSFSEDQYRKILLLTSEFWVDDRVKKHTIAKVDWLKTLSWSDFFIACPGFSHPLCHNLIEAMSVGVIPILEHPEYLSPKLENGKNCISFKGEKELLQAVQGVLAMEASEVAKLREGVLEYYDSYLTGIGVVNMLEDKPHTSTLYYYSSAFSFNLFKQKLEL